MPRGAKVLAILVALVKCIGWEAMGAAAPLRCFTQTGHLYDATVGAGARVTMCGGLITHSNFFSSPAKHSGQMPWLKTASECSLMYFSS